MRTIGVLFGVEQDWLRNKPTKKTKITKYSYGLFTRIGRSKGFKVIIGISANYSKKKFKEAYEYKRGNFEIVKDQKVDILFVRFWHNKKNNLIYKHIYKKINIFNHPELNKICWDKYACSKIFKGFMADSYLVNNKEELKKAVKNIDSEKIVIKPRFGIMGYGVKVINKNELSEVRENTIVQRFVDSSDGINFLGIKGIHDLRIVTLSGKIDHAYVRRPRSGLLSNIAQGGYVTHVDKEKLPDEVVDIVRKVDEKMKKYGPRLYTVDMMFEKGDKPVVTELESVPVIDSAYKSHKTRKVQRDFINHIFDTISELR